MDLPLYLGFTIMAVGCLALYAFGDSKGPLKHHTFIHSTVPFIAATMYLAMAVGTGTIELDGSTFYWARYADWAVTTPLLLTGLVLTGLHEHENQAGYLISVITLDVMMIVAGLFAGLASDPGVVLALYLWSCAAFAGVLYVLFVPVMQVSERMGGDMHAAYKRNLGIVTALWLVYPVIFAVGPEGLKIGGTGFSVWSILILDVLAKVGYGFVSEAKFKSLAQKAQSSSHA